MLPGSNGAQEPGWTRLMPQQCSWDNSPEENNVAFSKAIYNHYVIVFEKYFTPGLILLISL